MTENLEARIRRIEDRHAIQDLVVLYCFMCDERLEEQFREVFTADAVLTVSNGLFHAQGTEEIIAAMHRRWAPLGVCHHRTHGTVVHFDPHDPDAASGLCSSSVDSVIGGEARKIAIRYKDEYRRDRGRWKFLRRELSYLFFMPIADYAAGALGDPDRVRTGTPPGDFDWPEALREGADLSWIEPFFLP